MNNINIELSEDQLKYLRSGEYYNQLRFERDMLQDLVDKGEISKEDKEFIDCSHRNTELLEENKEQEEYIKYWQNEYDKKCDIIDKAIEEIDNSIDDLRNSENYEPISYLEYAKSILKGE